MGSAYKAGAHAEIHGSPTSIDATRRPCDQGTCFLENAPPCRPVHRIPVTDLRWWSLAENVIQLDRPFVLGKTLAANLIILVIVALVLGVFLFALLRALARGERRAHRKASARGSTDLSETASTAPRPSRRLLGG